MALGAGHAPGGLHVRGRDGSRLDCRLSGAARGRAGFEELPPPKDFTERCGPIKCAVIPGWRFLRRWGLGACLPTTWGWARRFRPWRLLQREWESNGTAACAADLSDVGDRQLAQGSRPLHAGSAGHGPSRRNARQERRVQSQCPATTRSSSRAMRCCIATLTS